jgi:hypothetical protein
MAGPVPRYAPENSDDDQDPAWDGVEQRDYEDQQSARNGRRPGALVNGLEPQAEPECQGLTCDVSVTGRPARMSPGARTPGDS